MSRQTDTTENFIISGNLSILPSENADGGNGSIEVIGVSYTDTILANTENSTGVNIENTFFNDKKILLNNTELPQPSFQDKSTFFLNGNFFKSINENGVLKIYNPNTEKGDLITHNGITDTTLSIGTQGQVLISDYSSSTNNKWSFDYISESKTVNLHGLNPSICIDEPEKTFINCVFPYANEGASGNFIHSKSSIEFDGNTTRLSGNPSINSLHINGLYKAFKGIELYKEYPLSNGDYISNNSKHFTPQNTVSLQQTEWSVAINQTSGIFFISIIPQDLLGPTAVYIVSKQVPALNTANILRINSSPVNDTFISLRWNSNSFIEINKSSNLFNKNYTIINNFQKDYLNISITLSQTEFTFIPKSFFKFYEKKSFFISISHSTNPEAPACIASVSKNKYNTNGNVFYCGSNNIEIKWNSQELLKIRKTTLDYNGVYSLKFTKIIP